MLLFKQYKTKSEVYDPLKYIKKSELIASGDGLGGEYKKAVGEDYKSRAQTMFNKFTGSTVIRSGDSEFGKIENRYSDEGNQARHAEKPFEQSMPQYGDSSGFAKSTFDEPSSAPLDFNKLSQMNFEPVAKSAYGFAKNNVDFTVGSGMGTHQVSGDGNKKVNVHYDIGKPTFSLGAGGKKMDVDVPKKDEFPKFF